MRVDCRSTARLARSETASESSDPVLRPSLYHLSRLGGAKPATELEGLDGELTEGASRGFYLRAAGRKMGLETRRDRALSRLQMSRGLRQMLRAWDQQVDILEFV